MKVFSLYQKIIRHNLAVILSYSLIFLVIFVTVAQAEMRKKAGGELDVYEAKVQVIDHDQSPLSTHLSAYLKSQTRPPVYEVEEDESKIQEALYANVVSYILVIPEGFQEKLKDTSEHYPLQTYTTSNASVTRAVDMKITSYLTNWDHVAWTYGGEPQGEDLNQALAKLDDLVQVHTPIQIYQERQAENSKLNGLIAFVRFMDYVLIAVAFVIVGYPIVRLESQKVKERDLVSGASEVERSGQIFLASYVFLSLFWLILILISFGIIGFDLLRNSVALFLILSSFVHMLAITSMVLLLSHLFPSKNANSFLMTTMSLFLAFSSGVFVPAEFLWKPFHMVSSIFPTFWDVKNQEEIMNLVAGERSLASYYQALWIMLGMAVLFFCLTLAHRYFRRQEGKI